MVVSHVYVLRECFLGWFSPSYLICGVSESGRKATYTVMVVYAKKKIIVLFFHMLQFLGFPGSSSAKSTSYSGSVVMLVATLRPVVSRPRRSPSALEDCLDNWSASPSGFNEPRLGRNCKWRVGGSTADDSDDDVEALEMEMRGSATRASSVVCAMVPDEDEKTSFSNSC